MNCVNDDKFVVNICCGGNFEYVNDIPTYMPRDCFRIRLRLPIAPVKPMNRRILLKNVLKKIQFPPTAAVSMRYIFNNHVFDITDDDEDFQEFLQYAIVNAPIEIYIVDRVIMHQPQRKVETKYSTNQAEQNQEIPPPKHPKQPKQPKPPKPPKHQSQQLLLHHDTEENLASNNFEVEEPEMPLPNTEEFDLHNYGLENVCKIKEPNHPFKVPLVEDSDSDGGKDGDSDAEFQYEEEKQDPFWNMPTLLSQHEEVREQTTEIPTTYRVSDLIKVRQTFLNKNEFVNTLFTKCLEENFQIKPVKSDKTRYTARCMLPNCEWFCSAYKIPNTENFMVKKLHDVHTCSRTIIMGNNKHATKRVLGSLLVDSFKSANREYKANDIRADIGSRFGVSISYNQAWRAKCHTLQMLRGSGDDSFRMLPIYLYNIRIHNPGSVSNLVTDKEDRFLMCYYSLGVVVSISQSI